MTLAAMEGDRNRVRQAWDVLQQSDFRDPEGWFLMARNMARVAEVEIALAALQRTVERGFVCPRLLESDPWFDSLRSESDFFAVLDRARQERDEAAREFVRLGGRETLGIPAL